MFLEKADDLTKFSNKIRVLTDSQCMTFVVDLESYASKAKNNFRFEYLVYVPA